MCQTSCSYSTLGESFFTFSNPISSTPVSRGLSTCGEPTSLSRLPARLPSISLTEPASLPSPLYASSPTKPIPYLRSNTLRTQGLPSPIRSTGQTPFATDPALDPVCRNLFTELEESTRKPRSTEIGLITFILETECSMVSTEYSASCWSDTMLEPSLDPSQLSLDPAQASLIARYPHLFSSEDLPSGNHLHEPLSPRSRYPTLHQDTLPKSEKKQLKKFMKNIARRLRWKKKVSVKGPGMVNLGAF